MRARRTTVRVIRSRVVRAGRSGAIELDAIERIAGQIRRVRSVHVYAAGAEIVLEEYAPTALFHSVDHEVFSPLTQSLTVSPAAAG